jgi:ribonuclease VapC
MTAQVLDASAVLAWLHGESGGAFVESGISSAQISSVNLSEVLTKVVERGSSAQAARVDLQAYGLTVHAFTLEDADVAADLRLLTRQAGLSFGDRACLALGRRLGLPVLTADRAWATLEVGVHIQLLR